MASQTAATGTEALIARENAHTSGVYPKRQVAIVRGQGATLREGMVLAIEPMVNAGSPGARLLEDRWTAVTTDGSFSAHFEHSVAVTAGGPLILTA